LKRLHQLGLHLCLMLFLFMGFAGTVPRLHAQPSPANTASKTGNADAPESNSETEGFRHAPAVQSLARHLGLSTETTAKIFEDLNSAIMIGAILWFLLRFVPKFFRQRSEALQRDLLEARTATEEAKERLTAVEERLSKLGIEIEAIREQTLRDSANDEKRIFESIEAEKQRIMASVEQEIESASAAARRDLKKYAATLAVDRAAAEIHLSDDADRALIRAFNRNFSKDDLRGERN